MQTHINSIRDSKAWCQIGKESTVNFGRFETKNPIKRQTKLNKIKFWIDKAGKLIEQAVENRSFIEINSTIAKPMDLRWNKKNKSRILIVFHIYNKSALNIEFQNHLIYISVFFYFFFIVIASTLKKPYKHQNYLIT